MKEPIKGTCYGARIISLCSLPNVLVDDVGDAVIAAVLCGPGESHYELNGFGDLLELPFYEAASDESSVTSS